MAQLLARSGGKAPRQVQELGAPPGAEGPQGPVEIHGPPSHQAYQPRGWTRSFPRTCDFPSEPWFNSQARADRCQEPRSELSVVVGWSCLCCHCRGRTHTWAPAFTPSTRSPAPTYPTSTTAARRLGGRPGLSQPYARRLHRPSDHRRGPDSRTHWSPETRAAQFSHLLRPHTLNNPTPQEPPATEPQPHQLHPP